MFQLMAIYNVCFGDGVEVKTSTIDELVNEGYILRSKSGRLSMSKEYRKLVEEISHRADINGDINGDINNLSDSLKDIYLIVRKNPGIKIKQVSDMRIKTESTVGKQLAELKKRGYIDYRGSKKTGGYYVTENKSKSN